MNEFPSVSIVIVNLNGVHHLPDCIRSIRRLDYPADRVEIIVVDNGSKDDSVALLKRDFPDVRLLCNTRNEGFAKPSNDGARAATGEYVAFLNNDMRVERGWLSALVRSLRDGQADCAGSLILNWDGSAIDFMEGGVGFYGYGFQKHFGEPLRKMEPMLREDRELLFACGGAMLLPRSLFLDAGGFDESYFAYYEDADLGWRLHVLGCKVVLSVRSRVCHRHNGTSRTMPRPRVQYLYERNKLYSAYKNYGEERFYKAFLPALLLEIREACLFSPMDPANFDIRNPAAFDEEPVRISQMTAMKLNALNEFVQNIPQLQEKRAFIQGRRKTDDRELLPLFTDPFIVFPKDTPDFLDTRYEIVKAFGLDTLFGLTMRCPVTFLLGEDETQRERYAAAAAHLAENRAFEVTVVCIQPVSLSPKVRSISWGDECAADAVLKSRVVVVSGPLGGWTRALAENARNKFLAVDASALEDSSEQARFLIEHGDYFLFQRANDTAAAARALREAGRLEELKKPDAFFWLQENGGDGNDALAAALQRFCMHPFHLPRRLDNWQPEAALLADEPVDASVEERLDYVERLLLREHRMLRQTGETMQDVRELSDLMDRRFRKLKGRLGRIPFLKRFIRD